MKNSDFPGFRNLKKTHKSGAITQVIKATATASRMLPSPQDLQHKSELTDNDQIASIREADDFSYKKSSAHQMLSNYATKSKPRCCERLDADGNHQDDEDAPKEKYY